MASSVRDDSRLQAPPLKGYLQVGGRARASFVGRLLFVAIAAGFTLVTRYIYVDVLGSTGLFDYMGVRVGAPSELAQVLFTVIAVLPAFWLPVHLRRPSDVIQLFLYYAVHIQTAVLMPLVSYSPIFEQFLYCVAITLGLLLLDGRYAFPKLRFPNANLSRGLFWTGIALFYIVALSSFAQSGYLSTSRFSFLDVYGQRLELGQVASNIGPLFFYLANWTGVALAPFLIIMGFYKKQGALVLSGIFIALASFIASSNKVNYMAVPAVIVSYYALRATRGRYVGVWMGSAFIALAAAVVLIDVRILQDRSAVGIPAVTWAVFHRIFSNNGFLSAIYLDLVRNQDFAFYADSFLRWLPGPRLSAPVAVLAGASFTDIPDVHANANLWADGYANLGYIGIAFASVFTATVLWLYDSISSRKDFVVTTAALIVPASVLANTATNVALTSNGVMLVFALVFLCPNIGRSEGTTRR